MIAANNDHDLAAMAAALTASGRYRVLRRLDPRPFTEPPDGSETCLGLFLDVETTGLDPSRDEIIEHAMVPFTYSLDGRIFEIHDAFQKLRDPGKSIPPEITAMTGITDEMVAGQSIDPAEVLAFASGAALVVAHNAAFDRRFPGRAALDRLPARVLPAGPGPLAVVPPAVPGAAIGGVPRRAVAVLR